MSDKPPTLDELWPECPGCESKQDVECRTLEGDNGQGWYFCCWCCDIEGPCYDTIEAAKAAFERMRE